MSSESAWRGAGEAATAEEAVALAVTRLPAGLGPAVTGTARRSE
ncbi:DUF6193 family natural product biosynthesis protein [Streptomyces sp. NPDC044571]